MRKKCSAGHLCFRSKTQTVTVLYVHLLIAAGSTIWSDLPWDTKAPWLLQSPQTSLQVKDRPNFSQTLLPWLLVGYYSTTVVVMDIQLEGCVLLLGMKTIVASISGWFKVLNEGSEITHTLQEEPRDSNTSFCVFNFCMCFYQQKQEPISNSAKIQNSGQDALIWVNSSHQPFGKMSLKLFLA